LGKYGRFFWQRLIGWLEVLAGNTTVLTLPGPSWQKVDAEEVLAEVKYRAW